MTAVPTHDPVSPSTSEPPAPVSRAMAFVAYGLLLLGFLTAGTTAFIGLILAYALRDGAPPLIQTHHRFQIRLFWIEVALIAAAIALFVSAFLDAGRSPPPPVHVPLSPHAQTIAYRPGAAFGVTAQPADLEGFTYTFRSRSLVWRTRALLEGYGAAVLAGFALLWGLIAPLYGAMRLASGRPMGHSAT